MPRRAHATDAGVDLSALEADEIAPGGSTLLRTGWAMAIPTGWVGLVADRSSLARRGLKTAGGVIDAEYRGEVRVLIMNLGKETQRIEAGDRIAQLLLLPVGLPTPAEVDDLGDETARGSGGFGSTGR